MNTHTARIRAQSFVRFAALAACVALSAYAQAGDRMVTVAEAVSTVGIDLATPEGARTLYVRLKRAARSVCGPNQLGLEAPANPMACYEDSLGEAIRSVNQPQLTMVYLQSHSIETAEAHRISVPTLVASK